MTEEALRMADEWNRHNDIGLNLQTVLSSDIAMEDLLESGPRDEPEVPKTNGNWKPLSFKLK